MTLLEKANQNRNQHSYISDEQQADLLNNITHVMDCECFVIDKRMFYREVSICNLKKNTIQTYHFYNSSFPQFHDFNEKQQRLVLRQSSIHGMYYRTRSCFDAKQSAKNRLEEIKLTLMLSCDNKQVVIGYKGSNFERRLSRYFDCFGVNIEFVDCPKFKVLRDSIFESEKGTLKKRSICCFHLRHRQSNKIFDCTREEVILFSCYVLKKCGDNYKIILNQYGCC